MDQNFVGPSSRFMQSLLTYRLTHRCTEDTKFGGIIYLHDITQDRAAFGPFWPIGHLPSPEPVDHVLLTTTKWDKLKTAEELEVGPQRLSELEREQWQRLIRGGATLCRFENTQDSAWKVVDTLLNIEPLDLEILRRDFDRIQKTMAVRKARLAKPKRALFAFIFDFIRSKVRILMFKL